MGQGKNEIIVLMITRLVPLFHTISGELCLWDYRHSFLAIYGVFPDFYAPGNRSFYGGYSGAYFRWE